MSYDGALRCFQENQRFLDPETDPVAWNLSKGLERLALQLQKDLVSIRRKLDTLDGALAHLR